MNQATPPNGYEQANGAGAPDQPQQSNEAEQLISTFYSCFQRLDWKGMLACYDEDIIFYDPVFGDLEGLEVRAMWEMLLSGAKDLQFDFSGIEADDGYGSCNWVASYTFSATGRRVVNKGKAFLKISGDKISEHQDDFSLWRWSRQALGFSGLVFGGTSFLQNSIRKKARKSLEKFMNAPGRKSGTAGSGSTDRSDISGLIE